jgi:peptide/nickel transport system permease protein
MQNKSESLYRETWRKLLKNKLALFGLLIIAFFLLIAVLGANIRPDKSRDANNQILEISRKKPGFEVEILKVTRNKVVKTEPFYDLFFFGGEELPYRSVPLNNWKVVSDSIKVELYSDSERHLKFSAFFIPDVLYAIDPLKEVVIDNNRYSIPLANGDFIEVTLEQMQKQIPDHFEDVKFILGTDKFGRDLLSRVMAGAVVSLSVGFIAVFISLIIGITLGAIAGYYRGWIDELIMWLINVVWSIPTILLVIAVTLVLGKGFSMVFIAVGLTMWVEVARVVRGQVMSIREKEFVEAGKALGYSDTRIIVKHILPNVIGPVIVISAANFAAAILIEAGLSFLGIGAQIPMASWGAMIKDHYHYITTQLAYMAIVPGISIMLLVLAFMLVGNGLREALDIRTDS